MRLHTADNRPALRGRFRGFVCQLAGLPRILSILADGRGQVLHIRTGLHQRCRLLFRALRQIDVALLNFTGGVIYRLAALHDLMNGFVQLEIHGIQRSQQTALISRLKGNFGGQITGRNLMHNRSRISRFSAQLGDQISCQQKRHEQGNNKGHGDQH